MFTRRRVQSGDHPDPILASGLKIMSKCMLTCHEKLETFKGRSGKVEARLSLASEQWRLEALHCIFSWAWQAVSPKLGDSEGLIADTTESWIP